MPPELPLVARARTHANRTAIVATEGTFSYADLLDASARVAACLLAGRPDLGEARVAFQVAPGFPHVAVQWGIWRAGGVALPLAVTHPPAELAYAIRDSDADTIVAHADFEPVLGGIEPDRRHVTATQALAHAPGTRLPGLEPGRRAMMVYTSGTTGKPKGAVTTHANIQAQVTSLIAAWEWVPDDRALLVLPLHHVHGIINVLTCALWAGARCEMFPRFDADRVWSRIAGRDLSLFMAVPTIYQRLVAAWESAPPDRQRVMAAGAAGLRLFVSGSAALPVHTFQRWKDICGHTLLERYGLTETGMVLSNPLRGTRRPGTVGTALPGVEVRLVDDHGQPAPLGAPGEIEVRGANVFREYWQRPLETNAAFRDGWFRTGDVGVHEGGYYRILGRRNVDIIKTGGFKVSALEIEEVLRTHPRIVECAVVGVQDPDWGERVCVAVELRHGDLGVDELHAWARERLAPYKIPRAVKLVGALPRNAMGKVTKPEVAALFRDG